MRGSGDRDANRAIVRIDELDPVRLLQVDDIRAAVTEDHAGLVNPVAKDIVDIDFIALHEIDQIDLRSLRDAAAIEFPSFVAVVHLDDIAFGEVLLALLVRRDSRNR